MKLEGIHHITAITGDAPRNVDFYVRVLGLRMVKKTVNQDDPSVYHLFYADERARPAPTSRSSSTRARAPGRAGAGMIHRIAHRVASPSARLLGRPAGRRGRRRRRATAARCASPIPRASSTSCVVGDVPTRR